ncbi:hypothetical protein H0H92_001568 [Tricholoma furcatifolium]|nr:hypothetical protein H0H92_001568 [Tricholoma furcatifolium]
MTGATNSSVPHTSSNSTLAHDHPPAIPTLVQPTPIQDRIPTPSSPTDDTDAEFWNPTRHREDSETSPSDDDDNDNDNHNDDNEDNDDPASILLRTPTTAERLCITRKNAVYERVVGAMRGSTMLDIPRSKPLRKPIDDVGANTRRFNRIVKDIMMQSERLGEETGCWLLFMAQLPSSKGLIHFSSSRLRRDAKAETLQLINQYQTVMRTLLAAKRDEAITIQKGYEEAWKNLDNAEQAKATMLVQLKAREAQLALNEAELLRYRLAASAGSISGSGTTSGTTSG